MKRLLIAAALAVPLLASIPARAADVGVSVQISQPGVYGRIDIGQFPQPALIARQPVIVSRRAVAPPPPIYMWVPPGHQRHWNRYCAQYHACGVPVYFVRDDWYRDHVRPHDHDRGRDRGDRDDHGHDRGHRDRGRDHDRR